MPSEEPTPAGPESNGRPTVYVIDSDPARRDELIAGLAVFECTVREFESAEAFLAGFGDGQTGCLILDLQLPGISGLGLLKRLQDDGVRLPVIVLTGEDAVATAVHAMRAGAAAYVQRPYARNMLIKEIRRVLE